MVLDEIKSFFLDSKMTVAFAESCTAGGVSAQLCTHPGVSFFYKGCVVGYQNEVKTSLLKVSKDEIRKHGVVSEPIALSMAYGVKELFQTQWALSTTGHAGPCEDANDIKGQVCFAVVGPQFASSCVKQFALTKREEIQQAAVSYALEFLHKCLYNNE